MVEDTRPAIRPGVSVFDASLVYGSGKGHFTQEDPIGLAGGMNLYGFASGDPVNFSDPFGLCVFGLPCPQGFVNAVAGFGDAASFGLSGFIRRHTAGGDGVDYGSGAYVAGAVAGTVAVTILTDGAGEAGEAGEVGETTEVVKSRPTPGRDGATSRHIIEKEADGTTRSVTHQVEKDGEILHQHQTHVGKYGGQRQFPDEWVKYPKVPKEPQ